MKKLILSIVHLVFLLALPTLCYADSDLLPPSCFEVGYELSSLHYSEPGVMDEDGLLHGIRGAYTVHESNSIMWRIGGRFSLGSLDYDGKTWGGTPLTMDTDDFILSMRGLLGRDCTMKKSVVTPFVGLGYRYWNNDSSGTVGGYEREIKYWYSPIGIETASSTRGNWIWGLQAEYDLFWGGKVTSHLSDAIAGLSDTDNNQDFGDGYGLRGSLYFKRPKNVDWPICIEVFIRYWDIEKSDITPLTYYGWLTGYGFEPANDTTEYGVRLSMQW